MTTIENNIEFYASLLPSKSCMVDSLLIEQTFQPDGAPSVRLEIRLRPSVPGEGNTLKLVFHNVVDLHINPGFFPFTLPLLEIFDVRQDQLEGINYRVKETEEENISFVCTSFSVTVDHL